MACLLQRYSNKKHRLEEMNDMMYMQSWRPATLPSLVALATTVTCRNACRLNGAWWAITAWSTFTLQMYDNTVSDANPPRKISTCKTLKSDLLKGWRPHYAHEGDISARCPGDDPEVLQLHSGFFEAAGQIVGGGHRHRALRHTADWHLPTGSPKDLSPRTHIRWCLFDEWRQNDQNIYVCLWFEYFKQRGCVARRPLSPPCPPPLLTCTALRDSCLFSLRYLQLSYVRYACWLSLALPLFFHKASSLVTCDLE